MVRSSHPSLPSANEPQVRRLSHGGGSERPFRAQLVIAFVLVLILVAVPLYLLRRPSGSAMQSPADAGALPFGGVIRTEVDASDRVVDVLLGPIQRVRCGNSARETSAEGGLCESLPPLEAALRESIRGNVECVPRTGKEGSINYVLEVDFASNRLNIFPGQSGNWRGPRARKATTCVLRAMPPVAWTELPHQYQYYAIAILATYPAPDPLEVLPTFD